jgi:hypothetical protein
MLSVLSDAPSTPKKLLVLAPKPVQARKSYDFGTRLSVCERRDQRLSELRNGGIDAFLRGGKDYTRSVMRSMNFAQK